ncbi:unnamed protein product [Protopolystoma xenopodis]|uniref:Uncharacterized protein n=1 Tax=Protopolystoma xenopodis TaxID=117903 RepID=A0A3S5AHR4_9PLAT|nr:unnamed protein product [Protopolystoma xenopodis]
MSAELCKFFSRIFNEMPDHISRLLTPYLMSSALGISPATPATSVKPDTTSQDSSPSSQCLDLLQRNPSL